MSGRGGRDQRGPMERLVRLMTVLHHAGRHGVSGDALAKVAGFDAGQDATTQLGREFRHMRDLGWQIENMSDVGLAGSYRMTTVDNRLRLKLTPAQQSALLRAVLLADRADLVERLALPREDHTELPAAVPAGHHDPKLTAVLRAVRLSCLLRFRYNGSGRIVHPQSVRVQNGTWYLRGCEQGSVVLKAFVVSRMLDVTADAPGSATPPKVTRHPGLHPMSWEIDPPVEVTLTSSPEFAADVRRWLGRPASEVEDDDVVTLVYRVTHRAALRSRVYQLGTRVRVVGPEEIRKEILDELALMAGV